MASRTPDELIEALNIFYEDDAVDEYRAVTLRTLISEVQRAIALLAADPRIKGKLRFKGDWYYCERGGPLDDRPYEECVLRNPQLAEWDHVVPLMWIDDPDWIDEHGGKSGRMPRSI